MAETRVGVDPQTAATLIGSWRLMISMLAEIPPLATRMLTSALTEPVTTACGVNVSETPSTCAAVCMVTSTVADRPTLTLKIQNEITGSENPSVSEKSVVLAKDELSDWVATVLPNSSTSA